MKIKALSTSGFAVLVSAMILAFAGTGMAHSSASSDPGSRFIQHFDKDGDGLVSKAEFPGPEDRFTQLDANSDGFIDAGEAPKGPPRHGMMGGGFIKKFDKDGDGKVSQAEFPGSADHFKELDANGDGFIDGTETLKGPPPHGMMGGGFIKKFDKDGDGKVSQAEFPGSADHFKELDANGDGFIDDTETPKGPPHHGMMGGGFIKKFDKDGDGKVSQAEFPGPADHFTQLDANGDGYIDDTEAPKAPPHHGMMGGGFIKKFDKDGDGKVSQAEFPGPTDHFTQLDANGDGYIDDTEAPKGPPPMRGTGKN